MSAVSIHSIDEKHLWNQPAGLIIKPTWEGEATGLFSNQAGEGACIHPEQQGTYHPLPDGTPFDGGYCLDEKYGIYCQGKGKTKFDGNALLFINRDLKAIGARLDPELYSHCYEGWLHIILDCGLKAVLTYGNCD